MIRIKSTLNVSLDATLDDQILPGGCSRNYIKLRMGLGAAGGVQGLEVVVRGRRGYGYEDEVLRWRSCNQERPRIGY